MGLNTALKLGVEEYTGRKVEDIQVEPDPQVPGTYAIRWPCFKFHFFKFVSYFFGRQVAVVPDD